MNLPLRVSAMLALALFSAKSEGPAQPVSTREYWVRDWKVEDGLPENTISAVLQTRDGYLWLGSYAGLVRFDGVAFTLFNNDNVPEMRDNAVTCLFQDVDGTLWIGHETGLLTAFKNGRFRPVPIPNSPELGKIISIVSDDAGDIWVMNHNGLLARARDGKWLQPKGPNPAGVAVLTKSIDGTVWLARHGAVFQLAQGSLKPLEEITQPANGLVQGLCPSHDGGLWIAGDARLLKWNPGQPTQDLGPAPWGGAQVHAWIETRTGSLVAGTPNQGCFVIWPGDSQATIHFSRTNGFSSDWLISLQEDREDGIWAGTGGGGLALLRPKRVRTIAPPDQWLGRAVLSVSPGRDGASLWIGTEGAGLYRFANKTWANFGAAENLQPYVWSAVEDSDGTLWAGTWGAGLYQMRNGKVKAVALVDGTQPDISAILCSQDGLWLGTETGLAHYNNHNESVTWYRQFPTDERLRRVRSIAEEQNGGIWFGTLGSGLGYLGCLPGRDVSPKRPEIRQFRRADGLASDFIDCLYLDAQGALWIGTQGAGLCRFKGDHFAAIGERQGLPSNFISNILEEGEYFWMSSRNGILRARKAELDLCLDGEVAEVPCVSYGVWDGMPTTTCSGRLQPAGCKTSDGTLWFPTPKGLASINPQEAKPRPLPPPVVIERFIVDDRIVAERVDLTRQITLKPGRHRAEFQYTGLSFVAPERVRFKYRLEGLETDWVDAGTRRTANYNQVPPGDYRFRVIACSSDGAWNQLGATAAFHVAPWFWQPWWFRILAGVAVAATSGGTVWFDSRRRTRAKLRQSEREHALERERSRIARDIHDDLGTQLTRITMLSESARTQALRTGQATAGISQIYDTARNLTRSMDEIVWAVNPKHDSLEGMAAYLEKFAIDFLGTANIACQLDFPIHFPGSRLTSEVRHNVFLAFKEAVNNVVKHARASEVILSLRTDGDHFELLIQDNGCGFNPAAIAAQGACLAADRFSGGNGLENLHRRLAAAGGTCTIESAPGSGTKVVFRVHVR